MEIEMLERYVRWGLSLHNRIDDFSTNLTNEVSRRIIRRIGARCVVTGRWGPRWGWGYGWWVLQGWWRDTGRYYGVVDVRWFHQGWWRDAGKRYGVVTGRGHHLRWGPR